MLIGLRSNRILELRMTLGTHKTKAIEATFRKDHHYENKAIGTDG